jgi:hypothetical protein
MPAKVSPWWEGRIKSLKAENPGLGAPRIRNALMEEYQASPPGWKPDGEIVSPPPSEKWVGNFLRNLTEDELRESRLLRWPESMERGDLAWEASAAALELLSIADDFGMPRPPVALARWYWRVSEAQPGAGPCSRLWAALVLASHRETGQPLPDSDKNNPWPSYMRGRVPRSQIGFWAIRLRLNHAWVESMRQEGVEANA